METRTAVVNFIKSLSNFDRKKVKEMSLHGVSCGIDFARKCEVDPVDFSNELKRVFEGK